MSEPIAEDPAQAADSYATDTPLSFADSGDGGLDLSGDAPQPEEASPYDPSIEDRPALYLRLVDAGFAPRPGVAYQLSGPGLAQGRSGVTDEAGELLIEDCGAGVYTLVVDGKSVPVHTLSARDLDEDESPYRVLV